MVKEITPTVLVVEDEASIATLIQYNLEHEGFRVILLNDGEEVIDTMLEDVPDVVLLDWMLPTLSGIEICKRIRENDATQAVPVIMLTARGEEADKVKGLDSGADDYIVKPFSPKELIARINAVLRRSRPVLSEKTLEYNGIKVDIAGHTVTVRDKPVHLGPTEFRLLCHLMEHPGQVFSRQQLLDAVWGHDVYVEVRTVDVHIRRLRKALSDTDPSCDVITTVRSAGYKIEAPST